MEYLNWKKILFPLIFILGRVNSNLLADSKKFYAFFSAINTVVAHTLFIYLKVYAYINEPIAQRCFEKTENALDQRHSKQLGLLELARTPLIGQNVHDAQSKHGV